MFADLSQFGEDVTRVAHSPVVIAVVTLIMATSAIWAFYTKFLKTAKLRGLVACVFIFLALAAGAYLASRFIRPSAAGLANRAVAGETAPAEDPHEKEYQKHLAAARQFRKDGLYADAIAAFQRALAEKQGPEATVELREVEEAEVDYAAQMKAAAEARGKEQYAAARVALERALQAKPADQAAARQLAEVEHIIRGEDELKRWFALPLPERPAADATLVLLRVDGADDADGVARLRGHIEEELRKAGKKVWRLGVRPEFVASRFDALWDGDVHPAVWQHRLLGTKPPELFVLARLTLSKPQKVDGLDAQSVRGTLRLRAVTGAGQALPVQEATDTAALVTGPLAADAVLQALGKAVEDGLVKKALR